jgi:hypothetical protein
LLIKISNKHLIHKYIEKLIQPDFLDKVGEKPPSTNTSGFIRQVYVSKFKYPYLSLIYDLKSFTFISLCLMFVGVAAIVGQFDSTNSVLAQENNESFFSALNSNNISGIDYGIISSMNQTDEQGNLDDSNVSSSSENQTNAP